MVMACLFYVPVPLSWGFLQTTDNKTTRKKKENERKKESAMRHFITFRSGILSVLTLFRFFYSNFQILYCNTPVLRLPLKGKPSVLDQKRENLWPCAVEMFNIHMFFRKW